MTGASGKPRLADTTVIWTGSREAAIGLLEAVVAEGARVERHPVVEMGPPRDPGRVRRLFTELDTFDWIVFTSAEAARGVAELDPPDARIGSVGPATSRQLEAAGWKVDACPVEQGAGQLSAEILSRAAPGERVLFMRGDKALRVLPERLASGGLVVDELEIYATRAVSDDRAKEVIDRVAESADVAIAGSPFGVGVLARGAAPRPLGELRSGLHWVAFGRTTAEALESAGVTGVGYPAEVSPGPLVELIARVLGRA